jgi:predicted amidohydrolase
VTLSEPLTCALVQSPPVFLNLAASLARATQIARAAARPGAKLIVFPETWLPGYPVWLDLAPGGALWRHEPADALFSHYAAHSPAHDGPVLKALAALAMELGADIVMGLSLREGRTLYNATALFGADGFSFVRRKLLPTYNEKLVWGQGDGSGMRVVDRPYGRLGNLICWEHWMPLARAALHAEREDIHVAQWPAVGALHQLASRHYAFEGQTCVIASGVSLSREDAIAGYRSAGGSAIGLEMLTILPAGLLKNGGSAVIGPDADYLLAPVFERQETLFCDIPPETIQARPYLDVAGHYARPDVFSLTVDRRSRSSAAFIDEEPVVTDKADGQGIL